MNENEHSRHNPAHYKHCQTCYEDNQDFMQETAEDDAFDADNNE